LGNICGAIFAKLIGCKKNVYTTNIWSLEDIFVIVFTNFSEVWVTNLGARSRPVSAIFATFRRGSFTQSATGQKVGSGDPEPDSFWAANSGSQKVGKTWVQPM
jgi:hypothetical protein